MASLGKALQPVVNAIWRVNRSAKRAFPANPFAGGARSFYSTDVNRLLNGWTVQSQTIDSYLLNDLTSLRARSRELARTNTHYKRYLKLVESNIVGDKGFQVQARLKKSNGEVDSKANDSIEAAFKDWAKRDCDYNGRLQFVDMQTLLVKNASQDGEFVARVYEGPSYGKYGFRIEILDAEILDINKNEELTNGNVVRLGVEYNSYNRPVKYWFREADINGNYNTGQSYSVDAKYILHGFLSEYTNQSRGIPWGHAAFEALKMLDKYNESAITAARYGAAKMLFLTSEGGEDKYQGSDLDAMGNSLDSVEAGSIEDIGTKSIESFDPKYPHEMYPSFNKSILRSVSSGLNISYASLASDLEDVNYSSIRAGVLEDRDLYKSLQGWFIREFLQPVVERWLKMATLKGAITVGSRPLGRPVQDYIDAMYYQGRRWAWTDPQKDGTANINNVDAKLKSRSQVIRDQGDDPETVWAELARENELMEKLGLTDAKESEESGD